MIRSCCPIAWLVLSVRDAMTRMLLLPLFVCESIGYLPLLLATYRRRERPCLAYRVSSQSKCFSIPTATLPRSTTPSPTSSLRVSDTVCAGCRFSCSGVPLLDDRQPDPFSHVLQDETMQVSMLRWVRWGPLHGMHSISYNISQ
jgi:hypothetical protein